MLVETRRAGQSLLPRGRGGAPSSSHRGRGAGVSAGSRSGGAGLVGRRADVPSSVGSFQSGSKQEKEELPTAAFSQLPSFLSTSNYRFSEINKLKQLTHPLFFFFFFFPCVKAPEPSCPPKQRINPLCTPSAHPPRLHLAPNVTRTDMHMLRSRAPPPPLLLPMPEGANGRSHSFAGGWGASLQQAASCGNRVPPRSLPRCLLLPRCALLGTSILRGGAAGVPVPGLRVTSGKEPRGRLGQVPPLWLRSIGLLRRGSTVLSYWLVGQPSLSALFEALRTVGAQRLPDHIAGLPGVFRLGDPCGPEGGEGRGGEKNTQSS